MLTTDVLLVAISQHHQALHEVHCLNACGLRNATRHAVYVQEALPSVWQQRIVSRGSAGHSCRAHHPAANL